MREPPVDPGSDAKPLWAGAGRFIERHPEYGIIALLLVAVPSLHRYVPTDSPGGPILYIGIVLVALPTAHRVIVGLSAILGGVRVSVWAAWVGGAIMGAFGIFALVALLPVLGLLPEDDLGSSPIGGLSSAFWEMFGSANEPNGRIGITEVAPSAAPRPDDDILTEFTNRVNQQISAAEAVSANDERMSFGQCIQQAYSRGDADEIVACADIAP